MDTNYNINLSDPTLIRFFNQSSKELPTCLDDYCCFGNAIANDVISNDFDKCFSFICNESYCKVFKGSNKIFISKPGAIGPNMSKLNASNLSAKSKENKPKKSKPKVNKHKSTKPDPSEPEEYTIDLESNNLRKEFDQGSTEPIVCEGKYCCFGSSIANNVITNNLNKCFYHVCNKYCCRILKGSNKQFENQQGLTKLSTSEPYQIKPSVSESIQTKSSPSKPNSGTTSTNTTNSMINKNLILFFCVSLLSNLLV